MLRAPIGGGAPEWTIRYYNRFLTIVRERGKLVGTIGSSRQVLVFAMHNT
jgi:hypothetical protein